MEQMDHSENTNNSKFSPKLILSTVLTVIGSSMLYGYNLAVLNNPAKLIQCFINQTLLNTSCVKNTTHLSNVSDSKHQPDAKFDAVFYYTLASVVFVISGAVGSFASGWLADRVGRRNGLIINHSLAFVASVLISLTVRFQHVAFLYLGRIFNGLNSGLTMGLAPLYLMEIAPKSVRGAIGTTNQLAITIGICVGYLATMKFTLNSAQWWSVAAGLSFIPALISLILLPFCPESPRFLFLKRNDEDTARKAFVELNRIDNVDIAFNEMRAESETNMMQTSKFHWTELFSTKDLRMPLLMACLIQIMQQLSGINAVITYSSIMLETAGTDSKYNEWYVLAIGILNVICTIVSVPLMEKAGRRSLLLWPTLLIVGSLFALTITVNLSQQCAKNQLNLQNCSIYGGFSVFFILLFIVGFAFGLGPIPSLIVSELFRQGPRAAAYSISQALQWTANLIVMFSFPIMDSAIGGWSFVPFLIVVLLCWIFFFIYMPETKNRSFDEIARDISSAKFLFKKQENLKLKKDNNKTMPKDVDSKEAEDQALIATSTTQFAMAS